MQSIGILGLGAYLPPQVRGNDWWPPAVVADWHDRAAHRATRSDAAASDELSLGARRTLAAMKEYVADPFRGAVTRHVMDESMTTSDMEAAAAREALDRAGVDPREIGAILTQTNVPEHHLVNSACITHRMLDLPQRCLALGTEAACNAFAQHATLAQSLIGAGQARYVLSIHSSAINRVVRPEEPDSAWWGDGAAAAVFGPVSKGKGLLSAVHNADGGRCGALVLGVPGGRWWDEGRVVLYPQDRGHTRGMLLTIADRARETILNALGQAGLGPADVTFYASHQGTPWFTRVTAQHAGLEGAATCVTFPELGNLNSANLPFVLARAERSGLLRDGATVVTFTGGVGETWSSICLRWGR